METTEVPKEVFSEKAAAAYISEKGFISYKPETLRSWRRKNNRTKHKLLPRKCGRRVFYPREDCDAFLKKQLAMLTAQQS